MSLTQNEIEQVKNAVETLHFPLLQIFRDEPLNGDEIEEIVKLVEEKLQTLNGDYDNDSGLPEKWSTLKLKETLKGLYESIYISECCGTRDVLLYEEIERILHDRGVRVSITITFNEED